MIKVSGLSGVALLFAASLAIAHHSLSAEFDMTQQTTWKGEVFRLDWAPPHVYVNVIVTDTTGNRDLWKFQGNPPHMMAKDGVTRDLIKVGAIVNVRGYKARSINPGSRLSGFATEIELPGGKKIQFGSPVWMPPAAR
jgi:hypothetical protein